MKQNGQHKLIFKKDFVVFCDTKMGKTISLKNSSSKRKGLHLCFKTKISRILACIP